MAAPLILARTFKDAHTFAKDVLGLSIGFYRVVTSPGTIKAVRGVDLYLVPGWEKRPDRFSMKSAIRFCRLNVIDVATTQVEPVSEPGTEIVEPEPVAPESNSFTDLFKVSDPAPMTLENKSEALADLEAAKALMESVDEPTTIEVTVVPDDTSVPQHHVDMVAKVLPEPDVTPEPAVEKPKNRRRSKCKDCEQLHYKDEPCASAEDE